MRCDWQSSESERVRKSLQKMNKASGMSTMCVCVCMFLRCLYECSFSFIVIVVCFQSLSWSSSCAHVETVCESRHDSYYIMDKGDREEMRMAAKETTIRRYITLFLVCICARLYSFCATYSDTKTADSQQNRAKQKAHEL